MGNKIKAIIFDWGRTLHNPEFDTLFAGVQKLVERLSQNYVLCLVSLAKSDDPKTRRRKIEESGITKYFRLILVGSEDKDEMYEKVLTELGAVPGEVIIVDDRILRGIAWGNRRGAMTIWFRNGKFVDELPTQETGSPTFTIKNITEVGTIAARLNQE